MKATKNPTNYSEAIKQAFETAKKEQLSLNKVINNVKKKVGGEFKDFVNENWDLVRAEFMEQMPHYCTDKLVKDKVTKEERVEKEIHVCEWVAAPTDDTKPILGGIAVKEYRYYGEETTVLENAETPRITREVEVAQTKILEDEDGNKYTVAVKDSEGKTMKHKVAKQFVPREKAVWGYTKTVCDALVKAVETVAELKATENK